MDDDRPPIVIGAGPAGCRAAATLAAAGLAPIVIDEAPVSGGQIYRRAPPGFNRPYRALYGFDATKALRLHETFDRIRSSVDYRPDTLVWDLKPGVLHCLSGGRSREVSCRDVILAPGARDRIIPFPGWTLPGIYTLGGAQIALKYQGCAVGRRIVFMGTGPLLYLVAYQYAKAGGAVAAVLDTTPFAAKRRAVPGLLRGGSTFAKGIWYVAALRARGIVMANGIRPVAAEEKDAAVSAFVYRDAAGIERRLACDAIAFGFGLSSETQLADLAEIPFAFDRGSAAIPAGARRRRTHGHPRRLPGRGRQRHCRRRCRGARRRARRARPARGSGSRRRQVAAGSARGCTATARRVPRRARGGLPVSGRRGGRDSGRDHPLPLRGRDRRRIPPRGARARRRRDQSRQGFQPLRHGALSGTDLRTGRRHRAGRGAESAARTHRPAPRPAAGQAPPDGCGGMSARKR